MGLAGEAEPAAAHANPLGPVLEILAEEVEEVDQQLAEHGGGHTLALGSRGPADLGREEGGSETLGYDCYMWTGEGKAEWGYRVL